LKDIKEGVVEIVLDANQSSRDASKNKKFIMPDGSALQVSAYISVNAGEVFFNPTLLGFNCPSLPQAIINSLRYVDPYYWRPLLKRIVIAGGSSLFKGLKERLEVEIEKLLPQLGQLPPPADEKALESKISELVTKELDKKEPEKDKKEPEKDKKEPEKDKKEPAEAAKVLFDIKKKETSTPVKESTPTKKESAPAEKELVQITEKKTTPENCSKCGELLPPDSNVCPMCGSVVKVQQIDILGVKKEVYPEKCPTCKKKLADSERGKFCPHCGAKMVPFIVDDKLDRKEEKLIKKTAIDDKELKKMEKAVSDEYGFEEEAKPAEKPVVEVKKEEIKSPTKVEPAKATAKPNIDEDPLEKELRELEELQKKVKEKEHTVLKTPDSSPTKEKPKTIEIAKPLNAIDPKKVINVILSESQKFGSFKGASIIGSLPTFKKFFIDYQAFSANPLNVQVDISKIISNK
jgi:predicted RNA-binding Zn-ribbon protein involved in translation (DUF1610 family)